MSDHDGVSLHKVAAWIIAAAFAVLIVGVWLKHSHPETSESLVATAMIGMLGGLCFMLLLGPPSWWMR